MPTRGRTSFRKRERERALLDKRRDKAERRLQRKLEKTGSPQEDDGESIPSPLPAVPSNGRPADVDARPTKVQLTFEE